MAVELKKVDVVIVGSGWAVGITAAELTKKGYNVVALERGKEQSRDDFIGAKDELKYSIRYNMMQDLSKDTVTARGSMYEVAKPVRNNNYARFGNDTGGASVHWNGVSLRWLPYDFEIHSQTVERYGKEKIPENCTIQDWELRTMTWNRTMINLKKQLEFLVKKTLLGHHVRTSIRIRH